MNTFKCRNCGHLLQGHPGLSGCPHCGGRNLKLYTTEPARNSLPGAFLEVSAVLVVIVAALVAGTIARDWRTTLTGLAVFFVSLVLFAWTRLAVGAARDLRRMRRALEKE